MTATKRFRLHRKSPAPHGPLVQWSPIKKHFGAVVCNLRTEDWRAARLNPKPQVTVACIFSGPPLPPSAQCTRTAPGGTRRSPGTPGSSWASGAGAACHKHLETLQVILGRCAGASRVVDDGVCMGMPAAPEA